jgi:hypothetical protein
MPPLRDENRCHMKRSCLVGPKQTFQGRRSSPGGLNQGFRKPSSHCLSGRSALHYSSLLMLVKNSSSPPHPRRLFPPPLSRRKAIERFPRKPIVFSWSYHASRSFQGPKPRRIAVLSQKEGRSWVCLAPPQWQNRQTPVVDPIFLNRRSDRHPNRKPGRPGIQPTIRRRAWDPDLEPAEFGGHDAPIKTGSYGLGEKIIFEEMSLWPYALSDTE